jgi:hypothetical protein
LLSFDLNSDAINVIENKILPFIEKIKSDVVADLLFSLD